MCVLKRNARSICPPFTWQTVREHEDRDTESRHSLREIHARQRVVAERERALDRREEELERVAEEQLWRMIGEAIRSGLAKAVDR